MHLSYVPTEDFLNSRPLVEFDDETKYIRAEADKLMKYLYVSVPHQTSKLPPKITTSYDRLINNGLNPYGRYGRSVPNDILNMSYYYEPTRATIGRGHLACVTFAGGRGYPRRKHLFLDEYRDIGDEIKVRSFYNKNIHHPNRLDEALALPTGFAYRLLTSDRKPYSTLEEEKKKNTTSRFKRSENAFSKTSGEKIDKEPKKEKFLDSDIKNIYDKKYDDIEIPRIDKKTVNHVEELAKTKKEEINQIVEKKSEEIIQSREQIEEITQVEEEVFKAPVEEKPKPKKESRRKLSEKLAEESDSKASGSQKETKAEEFKPSVTTRKKSEGKVASTEKLETVDKPVELVTETQTFDKTSNASDVIKTEETKEPVVAQEPEPIEPAVSEILASEPPATSESEPIELATSEPVQSIEEQQIEENIIESVQSEIKLEPEPIEVLDTTETHTTEEEIKMEVEKQEDEIKEVISNDTENKESEIKEEAIVLDDNKSNVEMQEEDMSAKEISEQVIETQPLETEAELKVDSDKAIDNSSITQEVNESSIALNTAETISSVTIVKDEISPVVESPKEETEIELTKSTITVTKQILIESDGIEIVNESSVTVSSDIKDTSEPIIEEPLSPEPTSYPFSDQQEQEVI